VAGTSAYLAPEILAEEVRESSRVSEMYSFGVMVWESMTRHIPHQGKKESTLALLAATKKKTPMLVVPSKPNKKLSDDDSASWAALQKVATACLSRDRANRLTSSIVVALWHNVKTTKEFGTSGPKHSLADPVKWEQSASEKLPSPSSRTKAVAVTSAESVPCLL